MLHLRNILIWHWMCPFVFVGCSQSSGTNEAPMRQKYWLFHLPNRKHGLKKIPFCLNICGAKSADKTDHLHPLSSTTASPPHGNCISKWTLVDNSTKKAIKKTKRERGMQLTITLVPDKSDIYFWINHLVRIICHAAQVCFSWAQLQCMSAHLWMSTYCPAFIYNKFPF